MPRVHVNIDLTIPEDAYIKVLSDSSVHVCFDTRAVHTFVSTKLFEDTVPCADDAEADDAAAEPSLASLVMARHNLLEGDFAEPYKRRLFRYEVENNIIKHWHELPNELTVHDFRELMARQGWDYTVHQLSVAATRLFRASYLNRMPGRRAMREYANGGHFGYAIVYMKATQAPKAMLAPEWRNS